MSTALRFSALIAALVAFTTISTAQLTISVDITVVNNTTTNELEVYVRPDEDFDQVFASSVFTIRWDASTGIELGAVQQGLPEVLYHGLSKSGDELDDSGYRYQVFAGFGFQAISATTQGTWAMGVEYKMMSIPYINGATNTFEIVNDPWTGLNNGDYYVSLNGQDRTGVIYSISTDVQEAVASSNITVQPNPTQGQVAIQVELPTATDINIELVNAAGQVMWNEQAGSASGSFTRTLDLAGYSAGSYLFRVKAGEHESVHPLIVE